MHDLAAKTRRLAQHPGITCAFDRRGDVRSLTGCSDARHLRPCDIAGSTRRMAAAELADLLAVDAQLKRIKPQLKTVVTDAAPRCSRSTV